MAQFIEIEDLIFLANSEMKDKKPKLKVINVDNIKDFSTEDDRYIFEGKVCTVIRTLSSDWGYIIAESVKDFQARLGRLK